MSFPVLFISNVTRPLYQRIILDIDLFNIGLFVFVIPPVETRLIASLRLTLCIINIP